MATRTIWLSEPRSVQRTAIITLAVLASLHVAPIAAESTNRRRGASDSAISALKYVFSTAMTCVYAQFDALGTIIAHLFDQPASVGDAPTDAWYWSIMAGMTFVILWSFATWNKDSIQAALGGKLNIWRHLIFRHSGFEGLFGILLPVTTSLVMDNLISEPDSGSKPAVKRTSLLFSPISSPLFVLSDAYPILMAVGVSICVLYILEPTLEAAPMPHGPEAAPCADPAPSSTRTGSSQDVGLVVTMVGTVASIKHVFERGIMPLAFSGGALPPDVSATAAAVARAALVAVGALAVEFCVPNFELVVSLVFYATFTVLSVAFSDGVHQLGSSKLVQFLVECMLAFAVATLCVFPAMEQQGFLFSETVWLTFWHAGLAVVLAELVAMHTVSFFVSIATAHFGGEGIINHILRSSSCVIFGLLLSWTAVVRGEAVAGMLLDGYAATDADGHAKPYPPIWSVLFSLGIFAVFIAVAHIYKGVLAATFAFVPIAGIKQGAIRIAFITAPALRIHRHDGEARTAAALPPGLETSFTKFVTGAVNKLVAARKSATATAHGWFRTQTHRADRGASRPHSETSPTAAAAALPAAASASLPASSPAKREARQWALYETIDAINWSDAFKLLPDPMPIMRMVEGGQAGVTAHTLSFEIVVEIRMHVPLGIHAVVPGFAAELAGKAAIPALEPFSQTVSRKLRDLFDISDPSMASIARISSLSHEELNAAISLASKSRRRSRTSEVRAVKAGPEMGSFLVLDSDLGELDAKTGMYALKTHVGFRAELDIRGFWLTVSSIGQFTGVLASFRRNLMGTVVQIAEGLFGSSAEGSDAAGRPSSRQVRSVSVAENGFGGYVGVFSAPNPLTKHTGLLSEHSLFDTTERLDADATHTTSLLEQIREHVPSWVVSVADGIRESSPDDVRRVMHENIRPLILHLRDCNMTDMLQDDSPLVAISDTLEVLASDMASLTIHRATVASQVRSSSFSRDFSEDDVEEATEQLLMSLVNCHHCIHLLIKQAKILRIECASGSNQDATAGISSSSSSAGADPVRAAAKEAIYTRVKRAHDHLLGRLLRWGSDLGGTMVESALVSIAAITSHCAPTGMDRHAVLSLSAWRAVALAGIVFGMYSLGDKAVGIPFDQKVFHASFVELLKLPRPAKPGATKTGKPDGSALSAADADSLQAAHQVRDSIRAARDKMDHPSTSSSSARDRGDEYQYDDVDDVDDLQGEGNPWESWRPPFDGYDDVEDGDDDKQTTKNSLDSDEDDGGVAGPADGQAIPCAPPDSPLPAVQMPFTAPPQPSAGVVRASDATTPQMPEGSSICSDPATPSSDAAHVLLAALHAWEPERGLVTADSTATFAPATLQITSDMVTLALAKLQAYAVDGGTGIGEITAEARDAAEGKADFARHCIAVVAEIAMIQTDQPTTLEQAASIASTLELFHTVLADDLSVPSADAALIATLLAWGGIRLCASFTDPATCVVPAPLDGAFRLAASILADSADAIQTL